MAGKTIWKGNIHFGEIDVPVKLQPAVREDRVRFHLLHRSDHFRLRQQMICAREKVPVSAEEQTRGYELEEGRYLLVDPAELEESRTIEIHEFVNRGQIDPLFLDRVYYVAPEAVEESGSSCGALIAAMEETDVAGICTWTMRKRSYLGALQVRGPSLRLHTLRHADEVIPAHSLRLPEMPLFEKELRIGSRLIEQLTARFEPEKFTNEHQLKLQELIDRKARGEKIVLLRPRRRRATSSDKLLQALEASLKRVA